MGKNLVAKQKSFSEEQLKILKTIQDYGITVEEATKVMYEHQKAVREVLLTAKQITERLRPVDEL